MDPISLLMTLVGAGGNLLGLSQSAKANKNFDNYINGMQAKNNAWYNKEYNTNYLDTTEAKAAIRGMLDQMKQTNENVSSSGAITGASAEKGVAIKGEQNKGFASALTQLAGMGTQRKQGIESMYKNREGQIDSMKLSNLAQKSQNGQQLSANSMGVAQNGILAGIMSGDGFDSGQTLLDKINAMLGRKSAGVIAPDMAKFGRVLGV